MTALSEEGTQRDVDRHTLGEQRQPLTPELGVYARRGGDRPARRDPRHEAADVGPRCDREGMEINHLFNSYHGVSVNPPDLPTASVRHLADSVPLNAFGVPGVVVNARGTSITRGSSILGGRRLDYL